MASTRQTMNLPRRVTRSTSLLTRPSPYNASVTLYESHEIEPPESELDNEDSRDTKRVKLGHGTDIAVITKKDKLKKADVSSPKKKITSKATTPVQRSPKKPKPIPLALAAPHPAPENWKEVYDTIKEMRSRITAPVDTMGCDQAQHKETDPKNRRFATLVSLMLSSQTKDEVTDAAVSKLREAVGGTLSVDAIIAADESVIAGAIAKVGFWRRKAGYLKQAAQKLRDEFGSDVPKTVDELCSLPGVGPKMAFLTLQVAWDLNHGIGVDVHVHRITNRLGWHTRPTKTPEETRLNLQSWLPSEYHREINHLLVGFGQTICLPVGPKCDSCELASKGLCPSAQAPKKDKRRTMKTIKQTQTRVSASPKIKVQLEVEAKEEEEESKVLSNPPVDRESTGTLQITPKEEDSQDF